MNKMIYDNAKKNEYIARGDFKESPDGLLRKELFPIHKSTSIIPNIILTITNVVQSVNVYHTPDNKSKTKTQWVLHFKENYSYSVRNGEKITEYKWSLPLALNITNARKILSLAGTLNIQNIIGYQIELKYDSEVTIGKNMTGGIRIEKLIIPQGKTITDEQVQELQNLIAKTDKNENDITMLLNITSLSELPNEKFEAIKQRLVKLALEKQEH
jgi:hypothetical protein